MKIVTLVVFLFVFVLQIAGQTAKNIKIQVKNVSLSHILLDLKENYGFQFAFDNDLLSKYNLSVNKTFHSEEEAIKFLVNSFPLDMEKSGEVFIIFPKSAEKIQKENTLITKISGQVVESKTYEPLPFSYISINSKSIQSDQQGNFSFLASADTTFNLRISHLGYFIYDTLLTSSLNRNFVLEPRITEIKEIEVKGSVVEKSTLIGDKPGKIKINHRIAPVLPGYGDNSVFNLLRLMPGILASGEQSNDLLIWGSYESHSKIRFDGFTLFGLKNFNDNISVINPFVVKDIEIYKGGYEARYGGRVGGIVDITGKNGSLQKPSFTFNINNTTVNSLLEIPLSQKASLLAAYRQTYYQLYDPTKLNLVRKKGDSNSNPESIDFSVVPDYKFNDANLKYTLYGNNGSQFYVSLYGGGDKFLYNMEGDYFNTHITRTEEEKNRQVGGAVFLSQPWKNGSISSFTASYSVFKRLANEENKNTRKFMSNVTKNIISENNVDEFVISAEHSLPFLNGNKLLLGAGVISNHVNLLRKSFDNEIINLNTSSPRIFSYVQNELPVSNFLELKTGVRFIYSSKLGKTYFEPRAMATFHITDDINLNASWGLYNQFMAKTSVVDSAFNYSYFWTNSDNVTIPVLHAEHLVGGLSYNKNGFTFNAEGYHKTTKGITRFFNGTKRISRGFYEGKGRSYGLDLFLKKEYKQHMAWVSYTLSKTDEHFPFFIGEYYRPAPQNQTHEIKIAGIINFNSFYFSSNYVYGSGFERFKSVDSDGSQLSRPYKRLDAALVYKFKPGKVNAEAGVSVLNVFDNNNIKYSNLSRASVDEINLVGIYAEAVPFTPALFLMLKF